MLVTPYHAYPSLLGACVGLVEDIEWLGTLASSQAISFGCREGRTVPTLPIRGRYAGRFGRLGIRGYLPLLKQHVFNILVIRQVPKAGRY